MYELNNDGLLHSIQMIYSTLISLCWHYIFCAIIISSYFNLFTNHDYLQKTSIYEDLSLKIKYHIDKFPTEEVSMWMIPLRSQK